MKKILHKKWHTHDRRENTIDIKIAQNYDVKYVECSFMNVQQFFKALKGTMNLTYMCIVCLMEIICRWCLNTRQRDIIILCAFKEKSIF